MGLPPPVPIVEEANPLHKLSIGNSRAVLEGGLPARHFCYDVDVVKRQAIRVGAQFVRHIVPAFIRPARTLWNEVIGFLFLCFGGIFAIHTVRYAIQGETGRLLVAAFCTLLMAWYGISSFRRARKISRS